MNYFTHGRHYIGDPYMAAGTAVPDWLSVVDRRVRARSVLARGHTDHDDRRVASLARGVVRHHEDDAWFHRTRAFAELSLDFTLAIRDRLSQDAGFRPSFLGHVLVEILLDAVLIEQSPRQLDEYYHSIATLDLNVVDEAVQLVVTRPVTNLPALVQMFLEERFLYDYANDRKLLVRLNRVMRRVKLPTLPDRFVGFLAEARNTVRGRSFDLLVGENDSLQGESQ